jgi:pimeloyl-ACP methyl ester carboxylesterase
MKAQYESVNGVFVEKVASESSLSGPPIVFVHGGGHGSWVWSNYLTYFASTGRDCFAFSWFNHYGSRELPVEQYVARSMADTVQELEIVAARAGQAPVLITHSMGAIVAQKYAEKHPVPAQVHLAPAICAEVGLDVEFEIDLSRPVERAPFEEAWRRLLGGCSEEEARRYNDLFSRESPTALKEAVTASVSVDRTRISGPSLMVAAEHDQVVPAEAVRRTAAYFGSDYLFVPGRSHNLILEPRWRETADRIKSWLARDTW